MTGDRWREHTAPGTAQGDPLAADGRAGIHLPSIGCADDLATAVKRDGQGSNS
jgi:hypothetical protein